MLALHFGGPDFNVEPAALVPKPRVNLTRLHGIFAPNSKHRSQVTPAGRGRGSRPTPPRTPTERHAAMTWARRLKRVFDIKTCRACGGTVKVIACLRIRPSSAGSSPTWI